MPINKRDIVFEDLTTKAYKRLKQMIISGYLKPGQRLNQSELAKTLGVSRTPLLQAMNRLSSELLTITTPRKGTRVRIFSNKDLLSIFEIRGRLEPYCSTLAVHEIKENQIELLNTNVLKMEEVIKLNDENQFKLLDNEFHHILVLSSNNIFLSDMLEKYIPLLYNLNLLKPMDKILEDHKNILDLLINKDELGISQLMHYHLYDSTKNKLLQILSNREE